MERQDWNARYAASELVWGDAPNRFVEREAADLTPGKALDLACGEGRNALWLAGRGWKVTAVDFADVAIERGRRMAEEKGLAVEWLVEDVVTWTPPPRAFDLVVVAYLQLPAPQRAVAFEHAATAVAPGGTLLVVAHDSRNLADGHGGPQDPSVLYTAGDIVGVLHDLQLVHAGEVLRPVTLPSGEEVSAIDCLVRAVRAA